MKSDSKVNAPPPGPIDNLLIENIIINGSKPLRENIDFYFLNKDQWYLIFDIYGGGPTICKKKEYSAPPANIMASTSHSVRTEVPS